MLRIRDLQEILDERENITRFLSSVQSVTITYKISGGRWQKIITREAQPPAKTGWKLPVITWRWKNSAKKFGRGFDFGKLADRVLLDIGVNPAEVRYSRADQDAVYHRVFFKGA